MSITEPQLSEVFTDCDTHVAYVRNTTGRPVYFLVVPSPGAKGIVVFRGRQSAGQATEQLPKLPHAVPIEGKSELLCLSWDGDLEVCRATEGGSVVVVAGRGEVATEKAAAEHSKLSGMEVSPHPFFCLPPLQFVAALLDPR